MYRWFFSVLFSVALFIVVLPFAAGAQEATTPTLTTEATPSETLGQPISDQATLTAPDGTDGNIVFRLYGPFTAAPTATDCTADKLVTAYGTNGAATVQVVDHTAASNPYTAPSFTPTEAGIYQWTAQFNSTTSGVDSTTEFGCGDATEQSVVTDDGGGGGGGNNDNNRNDNNRNDNNRNNNNKRAVARGATDHQYGGDLDIGDFGLGDNPGFGAGQDTNIPDDVVADTIPDGELPFTGGPPLFGLAIIGLACAGLGVAVLRGALRRTRDL